MQGGGYRTSLMYILCRPNAAFNIFSFDPAPLYPKQMQGRKLISCEFLLPEKYETGSRIY